MSHKSDVKYIVRRMKLSDCEEVRQIWNKLNFMGSKYDNQNMMKVDPQGFFVAQQLSTGNTLTNLRLVIFTYELLLGKLLGICSGVNISPDMSHIGQYGVLPEYQKLGIGLKLWQTVMDHIGKERNISLYARPGPMSHKYKQKYNFEVYDRFSICYVEKVDCNQLIQTIDGISIVPLNEDNIEKVIQYDKQILEGLDRTVLIREVSKIDEYVSAVAVNLSGRVLGYCMLKISNLNSGIVEPLYANDDKIAELLLFNCCQLLAITHTNGIIYACSRQKISSP